MFDEVKALTRGDPDDAILLAEQIKRLDSLFGQADNSTWREHRATHTQYQATLTHPVAKIGCVEARSHLRLG
jgi:hypothetical protein